MYVLRPTKGRDAHPWVFADSRCFPAGTRQDLLSVVEDATVAVVENGLEWKSEEMESA